MSFKLYRCNYCKHLLMGEVAHFIEVDSEEVVACGDCKLKKEKELNKKFVISSH